MNKMYGEVTRVKRTRKYFGEEIVYGDELIKCGSLQALEDRNIELLGPGLSDADRLYRLGMIEEGNEAINDTVWSLEKKHPPKGLFATDLSVVPDHSCPPSQVIDGYEENHCYVSGSILTNYEYKRYPGCIINEHTRLHLRNFRDYIVKTGNNAFPNWQLTVNDNGDQVKWYSSTMVGNGTDRDEYLVGLVEFATERYNELVESGAVFREIKSKKKSTASTAASIPDWKSYLDSLNERKLGLFANQKAKGEPLHRAMVKWTSRSTRPQCSARLGFASDNGSRRPQCKNEEFINGKCGLHLQIEMCSYIET